MYKEFDLEKAKNGAKIALRAWRYSSSGEIEYNYREARLLGCINNIKGIVFSYKTGNNGIEEVGTSTSDGRVTMGASEFNLVVKEEERIPFTIEDYIVGDVVEKDGKRVTIFTVKANGNTPIVGQVGSDERIHLWTEENAKQTLVIIR